MNEYVGRVSAAAQTWVDSFDQGSAGISIVDLIVRDPYDEEPELALQLRELVGMELQYVLDSDAAARAEAGPVSRGHHEPETSEVLRYAATRVDLLTNSSELAPGGVDEGWPTATAAVLFEASRMSELLAELITYATGQVTDNLAKGRLVALRSADAKDIPNQTAVADQHTATAEAIAELLGTASGQLADLSDRIAELQHTVAVTPGASQDDGPTLATEAVLEIRLPGSSNQSRFHVRIFRPADTRPVVVIGNMADNHSQSITNAIEEVAATVAEVLLNGAAHDSVTWVQLYPPGEYGLPAGQIQLVRFEQPYGSPRWQHRTHGELEELAGGEVRSWHAKDYTVPAMTRRRVQVLRPETRRRRPHRPAAGIPAVASQQPVTPSAPRNEERPPWWKRWLGR